MEDDVAVERLAGMPRREYVRRGSPRAVHVVGAACLLGAPVVAWGLLRVAQGGRGRAAVGALAVGLVALGVVLLLGGKGAARRRALRDSAFRRAGLVFRAADALREARWAVGEVEAMLAPHLDGAAGGGAASPVRVQGPGPDPSGEVTLAGLVSALARLTGKPVGGNTMEGRLRVQRVVYLLKALGYAPACRYRFTTYFRGPYSRTLAGDLREIADHNVATGPAPTIPEPAASVVRGAASRGDDFLEAVVVLHSTATNWVPRLHVHDRDELVKAARQGSPHLDPGTAGRAHTFLLKNRLL